MSLPSRSRAFDERQHPRWKTSDSEHRRGQFRRKTEREMPGWVRRLDAQLPPLPNRIGKAAGLRGVRPALMRARTADDVARTATEEIHRLSGRVVTVRLDGVSPQIAREYAEGILRGVERFPQARLTSVYTVDLINDEEAFGATSPDGGGWSIRFPRDSERYGSEAFRQDLRERHLFGESATRYPIGVALHEFGHMVANQYQLNHSTHQHGRDYAEYVLETGMDEATRQHVSGYAATSNREYAAEVFADAMLNGPSASAMSRDGMRMIEHGVRHWHQRRGGR